VSPAGVAPSALQLACMRVGRMVRRWAARFGARTEQTPTNGRAMSEDEEYRYFRVESAEPYGWVVYLEGTRRTHFFMARGLALSLAKLWAQAVPPSKVQLVDLSGRVTQEWTFKARLTSA
jgi:hypothetical protein